MAKVDPILLWMDFFNKEHRIARFGAGGPYDESIWHSSEEIGYMGLFQSGRIQKERDFFNFTFDSYLKDKGFIPDPSISDPMPLIVGSKYQERRIPNWIRYSHSELGDLWVNYSGHTSSEGAWQDILLTNSPERIRTDAEFRNNALAEGLVAIL